MSSPSELSSNHPFLSGGGEMGRLIRAHDWSQTAVGPVEGWSPALRMQVSFLLANRFPMLLWWGPTFCSIYNDAYAPILGTKHPWALGRPVSECWSEVWDVLKPLIETPFNGGPPTWIEDFELELNRHGYLEEGHFTVAYSPVPDETAPRGIGGVVATVHEITGTVVGRRRVAALRDLGSRAGEAKTAEQACAMAAATLAAHGKDLPFVLLYLLDAHGQTAKLAGSAGVAAGEDISPLAVDLGRPQACAWPLAEARRNAGMLVVGGLAERFSSVPRGRWSDAPHAGIVMQIPSNKAHEPAGLLVGGISPRLKLDEHYRDFFELLRTQLATAIANARAYEDEKKRGEALAEIDRAKTAFFSNVSHEFRTPLTLMLGPVGDLLGRGQDELSTAAKGQLEVVNRNGLRLLRLVNTLLDFSRIEAGRVRAVYQATDLAPFTAELASVFRSAIERAGMRLEIDCRPLASPVYVDRDMWEKVVLNLLSNAFKYTLEGEIRVSLRQSEAGAELRVSDTGTGIPAAEMPRLFERFHRVENAQGRTHEGSGIGLALVQELVKLHGGSISAQSAVGEGTAFTITLPLGSDHLPPDQIGGDGGRTSTSAGTSAGAGPFVEEALRWLPDALRGDDRAPPELPSHYEADPVPALRPEHGEEERRPLVLVADDNADMRQYVVRLLAEHYRIRTAPDGAAALAAILEEPPDLVLTDVMMPRLDGFGLLQELRADPRTRDVPVIMLSARAGEESRVDGMCAGADDYLIKPFSARELLARVGAHLQMTRLRREAADALRSRTMQYETLLNCAPLGVYMLDSELIIREANPVALQAFSDVPGGVLGRDFDEVVHFMREKNYADEVVGIFRGVLETGKSFFMPERARYRADRGVTEYYAWRVDRITMPDGRYGLVCYFRDISEEVGAREALKAVDRRKDEFLATLAHELRNPLAPIQNNLQILRMTGGAGPASEHAQEIMERQVAHLVRLVDDLMELSRISRGQCALKKELVELATVVRHAVEISHPVVRAGHHELAVSCPEETILLQGDPVRLAQVFANLLNNAAKYTERGGRIAVEARRAGGEVEVSVRDTGIGIPSDMLERVFDMFAQVTNPLRRTQDGLGIGLSLVRTLVTMHGGTVEARSRGIGQGSEFVVRLPIAEPAEAARPEPPQAGERKELDLRVLVVDDNRDGADSLSTILKLLGADVHVAYDGPSALEMLQICHPTVVLLDIGMPGMDGHQVAERVRADPRNQDVTLIAMTGWGQDSDRRRSKAAGFAHHLVKPVEFGALKALLLALKAEGQAADVGRASV